MIERRSGRIVCIASDAGRVGSSGEVVYSATKGGVIAFGKALAREVARDGITGERGVSRPDRHRAARPDRRRQPEAVRGAGRRCSADARRGHRAQGAGAGAGTGRVAAATMGQPGQRRRQLPGSRLPTPARCSATQSSPAVISTSAVMISMRDPGQLEQQGQARTARRRRWRSSAFILPVILSGGGAVARRTFPLRRRLDTLRVSRPLPS